MGERAGRQWRRSLPLARPGLTWSSRPLGLALQWPPGPMPPAGARTEAWMAASRGLPWRARPRATAQRPLTTLGRSSSWAPWGARGCACPGMAAPPAQQWRTFLGTGATFPPALTQSTLTPCGRRTLTLPLMTMQQRGGRAGPPFMPGMWWPRQMGTRCAWRQRQACPRQGGMWGGASLRPSTGLHGPPSPSRGFGRGWLWRPAAGLLWLWRTMTRPMALTPSALHHRPGRPGRKFALLMLYSRLKVRRRPPTRLLAFFSAAQQAGSWYTHSPRAHRTAQQTPPQARPVACKTLRELQGRRALQCDASSARTGPAHKARLQGQQRC